MDRLLTIGAVLLGMVLLALVLLLLNAARAGRRQRRRVRELLVPIIEPLAAGRDPDPVAIHNLAARPLTRNRLREHLDEMDRPQLFPGEFRSRDASAESELAYWLSHGNELGVEPDEIKLANTITVETDLGPAEYLLFKFRVFPPHWASGKGWMAGIAGPFIPGRTPAAPSGAFSELIPFESRSPQQHVRELHDSTFDRVGRDNLQQQLSPAVPPQGSHPAPQV